MSGNIKILIILLLLFAASAFPQSIKNKKQADKDTVQSSLPAPGNLPLQQNIYKLNPQETNGYKVKIQDMYRMYFLNNQRNYSFNNYNELDFSDLFLSGYSSKNGSAEDSLRYFNKNLSLILNLQYKELNKFDLGIVSQVLGISEGVLSAFLAVRSLRRFK